MKREIHVIRGTAAPFTPACDSLGRLAAQFERFDANRQNLLDLAARTAVAQRP